MAGKLLSSFSWWLPPLRQSIIHGGTALDGTKDSPGELLGIRMTPFCPLLHALTVERYDVLAGLQFWAKFPRAMHCYRLPLPERALFA